MKEGRKVEVDKSQSATTKVRSPRNFDWLFSIRGETVKEQMEHIETMEKLWLEKGWEPIPQNAPSPSRMPQISTKQCETHNVTMKEKISKKTGKAYFSHWEGTYPDLGRRCFGNGYQD